MSNYADPRLELLHQLETSQTQLLKDLKSLNRKGLAGELVGCAMVMAPAYALMTGNISVGPGVAWMGLGLLVSVMAVRYLLTAASLPATRLALEQVEREMERLRDLELDHPARYMVRQPPPARLTPSDQGE